MFEYEAYIKEKRLEGHGLRKDEIFLREAYRRAEIKQGWKARGGKSTMKKHLEDVHMTYTMHLKFAWIIGLKLFILSLTALVHGIFPFIWVRSVSDSIKSMAESFKEDNP